VVVPEQTEGPYFVDLKLNRSDIRSDPSDGTVRDGAPLALTIRVAQVAANACTPLASAVVDIWQCDAAGAYSGVRDANPSTAGKQFLRGYQTTDAQGRAQFQTIYPSWYPGRTVHIHFKVRTNPADARGSEFTSQLYFDDAFTDQVYARAPYTSRSSGRTRNSADGIFRSGGQQLTLQVTPQGQGYAALFDLGLRA